MAKRKPTQPYGGKGSRKVPSDILVKRTYSSKNWDEDPKVFRATVLQTPCPYCQVPAGSVCVSLKSGKPKVGPYAAGFHMDRVYATYY